MIMEKLISAGLFGMINTGAGYIIGIFFCAAISYVIGSVNFICRAANRVGAFPDTTGVIKAVGLGEALGADFADMLKGALCAMLGIMLMPGDGYAGFCAIFCLLGQAFPIFYGFKGGGGGAVVIGAALVMNPLMAFACALIGFAMYAVSGFIPLGSVSFACVFPFLARRAPLWRFAAEETKISLINLFLENLTPIALAVAILLIYASAIGRMIAGDEPKIPLKKKKI